VQTFRKRRAGLSAIAGLSCLFITAQVEKDWWRSLLALRAMRVLRAFNLRCVLRWQCGR